MSQNQLKKTRNTSTKSLHIFTTLFTERRIVFKQRTEVYSGYLNTSVLMTWRFERRLGIIETGNADVIKGEKPGGQAQELRW